MGRTEPWDKTILTYISGLLFSCIAATELSQGSGERFGGTVLGNGSGERFGLELQ